MSARTVVRLLHIIECAAAFKDSNKAPSVAYYIEKDNVNALTIIIVVYTKNNKNNYANCNKTIKY